MILSLAIAGLQCLGVAATNLHLPYAVLMLLLLKWDLFQVGTFREFILFDSDQAVVLLLHLFEALCAWLTGIPCFYSALQALVGGKTTIRHKNATIAACLE